MKNLRILVYTPIGVKTGGPECLYQICHTARQLGLQAFLIPTWETRKSKPCKDFEIYSVEYLNWSDIQDRDFLIIPEMVNKLPKAILGKLKQKLIVWWLSVDNSPVAQLNGFEEKNHKYHESWSYYEPKLSYKSVFSRFIKFLNNPIIILKFLYFETKLLKHKVKSKYSDIISAPIRLENCIHVSQSKYASDIVARTLGLECSNLNDYVEVIDTVAESLEENSVMKERKLIAYNPNKGGEFLKRVIEMIGDTVDFYPLSGLSTTEVRLALKNADCYLDLGHFPGRDRIPREAILSSCPVLLAKRGAARNDSDFPIPLKFKIDLESKSVAEVSESILKLLLDGKERIIKEQSDFFQQTLDSKSLQVNQIIELHSILDARRSP